MNIYSNIRCLAKSQRMQNLLVVSKELHWIRLFRNNCDFSRIQEEFILFLYMYESLAHDVITDKISKHVYDKELYEDSYLLWKREKGNKKDNKNNNTQDVKLIISSNINFPKQDKNK